MEVCQVGAALIHEGKRKDGRTDGRTDRLTDMTNVIGAFRDYARARINHPIDKSVQAAIVLRFRARINHPIDKSV
jgi:hypothetical protein